MSTKFTHDSWSYRIPRKKLDEIPASFFSRTQNLLKPKLAIGDIFGGQGGVSMRNSGRTSRALQGTFSSVGFSSFRKDVCNPIGYKES